MLQDKQQKARICLCAQSHAAVDELLRRLDKQNKMVKKKGTVSHQNLAVRTIQRLYVSCVYNMYEIRREKGQR